MNSSTSSSREVAFLAWVLTGLAVTGLACQLDVWTGLAGNHRRHVAVARLYGSEAEFLILGDSKTGPFSHNSLAPVFGQHHGLVFDADSVTPSYHLYNWREVRRLAPELKPRFVFLAVGANNFNRNGLHCLRDLGLYDLMPLADAARLTWSQGEYLAFAEVLLSRIFPVYAKRVPITHLSFAWRPDPNGGVSRETTAWQDADELLRTLTDEPRSEIADRNYLNIYRRSVYRDFAYSRVSEAALGQLVEELRGVGAEPVLVLLPVGRPMRELERSMIGDGFDSRIEAFAAARQLRLLDLRDETRYAFQDVNHLSPRGAIALFRDHLEPLLEE